MRRVIPIFLLVFVDILGLTVILPLLHLYATAYGAGPLEVGIVVAAFPLAQLLGVPMMGALSDRYGRRPLLLISQVTTCISFIMLGLANSLALIILSRLFDGLFGANIATAQAALSDITDDSNRTRGLGIIGAAFGLGFIFGPAIAILTFELTDSLAAPAFTAALYSFLSILITALMFKETHPRERRAGAAKSSVSPMVIFRYLSRPFVGLLLLLMFAQQLIFFGFESLLGLFTLTRLGFLGQGNAALFLLVGIILVIVQMRAIGPWSQKFGERRLGDCRSVFAGGWIAACRHNASAAASLLRTRIGRARSPGTGADARSNLDRRSERKLASQRRQWRIGRSLAGGGAGPDLCRRSPHSPGIEQLDHSIGRRN